MKKNSQLIDDSHLSVIRYYLSVGEGVSICGTTGKILAHFGLKSLQCMTIEQYGNALSIIKSDNMAEIFSQKEDQPAEREVKSLLFKVPEAALFLGVSGMTLKKWVKAGRIPSYRNTFNHRVFKQEDLATLKKEISEIFEDKNP